jgi:signal peptidase II
LRSSPRHSYLADSVRLDYAENPGAFLSMGAQLPPAWREGLLTWGVGALLCALAALTLLKREVDHRELVSYALFLGGGLSNWADRVVRGGSVVDFMNLGLGTLRTGIFNVADLAIVAGVVLLAWPRPRPQSQ